MAVTKALAHKARMTAVARLLEAPENSLAAGSAWPTDVSAPMRGTHLKPLRPFLEVNRPAKNRDSVYTIPAHVLGPLQRALDALEGLAAATSKRSGRAAGPVAVVSKAEDGTYLVNGEPVESRRLAAVIKQVLQTGD